MRVLWCSAQIAKPFKDHLWSVILGCINKTDLFLFVLLLVFPEFDSLCNWQQNAGWEVIWLLYLESLSNMSFIYSKTFLKVCKHLKWKIPHCFIIEGATHHTALQALLIILLVWGYIAPWKFLQTFSLIPVLQTFAWRTISNQYNTV